MNREDFFETFLKEMPNNTGIHDPYPLIQKNIKDFLNELSAKLSFLTNNIKKLQIDNILIYYIENQIGIELEEKPYGLVITSVGKNPLFKKQPPYASDLYIEILKDSNKSLIISDATLTTNSFKTWKRLFNQGYKISLYDMSKPGQTFKTIETIDQMEQYFKTNNKDYEKYRYVLSESNRLIETSYRFGIKRYRELSGT